MNYTIEPKVNQEEMGSFSNEEVVRYALNYLGTDKIVLKKDIVNRSFCYNYALNDETLEGCDEAFEQLEKYYKRIPISEVKRWDLISYHRCIIEDCDDSGNIVTEYKEPYRWNSQHFAKVLKTDGTIKGTMIRSKWGTYGIFDTQVDMIIKEYGETIIFWRRKGEL